LKKSLAIFLLFFAAALFLGSQASPVSPLPQRIISLAPNITEILFALGLENQVIGVTRYCDFPPEALKKEKIGGFIDPNLEKIQSLNPDLIIGFRGNPLRVINHIKNLNLPVYVLDVGNDLESVFETIEKIGLITHKEKEAQSLIANLGAKYSKIEDSLQSVKTRPKVFLSLHGMGLWTCGKESYLNDLIAKAKGVNIAGNIPKKWLLFTREQVIHENPDTIIIMTKSKESFRRAKEWFQKESHLGDVRAVKEDRIYLLDENISSRFGPRLVEAFEQIALILHSEQLRRGR
jgi:iron complex transport system substrate-binding protein